MEDELELPRALDDMVDDGLIDISHELGTLLPHSMAIPRVQHHFSHTDLGYRRVADDTFSLHVKGRKYPLFGSWNGEVHILERLGHRTDHRHVYAIEGFLRFRISLLWFLAVISFFFLVTYVTTPGFWPGAVILALGSGLTIYSTYQLGRGERDAVVDRVEASFLQLRATINNLR